MRGVSAASIDYRCVDGLPLDDLDRIARIMQEVPGSSVWTARRIESVIGTGDRSASVVTATGQLAGFAVAYASSDLNTFLFPGDVVLLRRIVVLDPYRGLGLGQLLLERVTDRAGGTAVGWQTSVINRGANDWFRRIGLVPVGYISRSSRTDCIYWVEREERP